MEHQNPDIALAINQISGLDVNVGILLVGGICIFYTSIGGMKAVIWTDVWQIMWMVAGFVAILAVTCIDFGGFMEVVNLNIVSRRFPVKSFPTSILKRFGKLFRPFQLRCIYYISKIYIGYHFIQKL